MTNRSMVLAALAVLATSGCKQDEKTDPAPAAKVAAGSAAPPTGEVATPPPATPEPVPAPAPAEPTWQSYTSKEGKFTIDLPSKPEERAQGTMTMVTAEFGTTAADSRTATCGAVYMALPAGGADPKVMFDGATARHKQGAKLIEEKDVKLGEVPGRSLIVENDSHRKWMRMYATPKMLYIINCGGPFDRAASDGEIAIKALDSFKLVN